MMIIEWARHVLLGKVLWKLNGNLEPINGFSDVIVVACPGQSQLWPAAMSYTV